MIITAKVARWQAAKKRKEYKDNSAMRELRAVEKAINRASQKGKSSIVYRCLHYIVYEVLERNGYKINIYCNIDRRWVVISWDEEK